MDVARGADKVWAAPVTEEELDPKIEALNLRGFARRGAYALKAKHPTVVFTSGRRDASDQARAMSLNVCWNRKWIEQTYRPTPVSAACQRWVDAHPAVVAPAHFEAGFLGIFAEIGDAELSKLSKHLTGDAFDIRPVYHSKAQAIKDTIRGLAGLDKFLDREGGMVIWHAQFHT